MMFRILMGGFAGGIVMFAWFSIAHMSAFGETGISHMPREILVTSTLDSGVGGMGGLYVFPASAEAGPDVPSGFMVYDPDNIYFGSMQSRILLELAKDIGQALILAILMAMSGRHDFPFRLGFAAGAGVLAGFSAHLSHSIWFGFPWAYAFAQGAIIFIGFVLAGLVMAILMPRPMKRVM
jgi:hypothetical protein